VPSDVVVVLDEAYFEYVNEAEYANGLTLISDYPNLVVTRTFSKAYGLASLRMGYGISSPEVADLMNRVRPPFNANSFALAAAVATLNDDEYVAESKAVNDAGMAYLTQSFDQLGLPYIPSVGNFISFEIPVVISGENSAITAEEVDKKLLAVGIIIRPIANYEMPNHLRVSIGTEVENKIFIVALSKILSDARS
jgi:histidinol-phosphate aminotransferase